MSRVEQPSGVPAFAFLAGVSTLVSLAFIVTTLRYHGDICSDRERDPILFWTLGVNGLLVLAAGVARVQASQTEPDHPTALWNSAFSAVILLAVIAVAFALNTPGSGGCGQ